jgi:excisionase family DNA binding protein
MLVNTLTMTESDFAKRVGVSRMTIQRHRYAGKLSHYKVGTRILYGEKHVEEFLNSREKHSRLGNREK